MPTSDDSKRRPEQPNEKPDAKPQPTDSEADAQRKLYIADLIKSGKAAVAKDGKLPPGATHEIVGTDADGQPILVRRRFS
jgi:hypothetical protein